MKVINLIFVIIISNFTLGQIFVSYSDNPIPLIQDKLAGNNVTISNINYGGSPYSIGSFVANIINFGMSNGIVLTTGLHSSNSVIGPNNQPGVGYNFGGVGSNELNKLLININTHDAVVIGFDIIPDFNSLELKYIFGSEEYPEFVDTDFNDLMGIYIEGPGYDSLTNIALTPSNNYISINNINSSTDSLYFINNGNGSVAPFNSNNKYIQFDGYTTLLKTVASVSPGSTYKIYIIIADAKDAAFDSGIFIQGNSITSGIDENLDVNRYKVSIFPNPINENSIINLELVNSSNVSYSIQNTIGEIVEEAKYLGVIEGGKHEFHLNIKELKSGMYFIHFKIDNEIITKKIIVK